MSTLNALTMSISRPHTQSRYRDRQGDLCFNIVIIRAMCVSISLPGDDDIDTHVMTNYIMVHNFKRANADGLPDCQYCRDKHSIEYCEIQHSWAGTRQ